MTCFWDMGECCSHPERTWEKTDYRLAELDCEDCKHFEEQKVFGKLSFVVNRDIEGAQEFIKCIHGELADFPCMIIFGAEGKQHNIPRIKVTQDRLKHLQKVINALQNIESWMEAAVEDMEESYD